jgi:transposase
MKVSFWYTCGLFGNWLAWAWAWAGVGVAFWVFVVVWDDWRVAKRYRPVRRDQLFLLAPDMREWLPPQHPVWLVIRAVEDHLDTSVFHAARKTGGAGAAGYDPDMLVTVLVWAYAHQVTSSRRIEQLCVTDVAFRVICGGNTPDHVTVAEFRRAFPAMAGQLFAEVLALCARLGMGKLGVVALDGMKIAASAGKAANRTEETLAKLAAQTVARHGQTDEAEDVLFGAGMCGDEVPADAWSPRQRDQRIAAALASVRAEREAVQARREAVQARREADAQGYLQAAAAGQARPGKVPAAARVEAARLRLERAEAAQRAKVAAWQQRRAEEAAAGVARGPGGRKPPLPPEAHFKVRKARAVLEKAKAAQAAEKVKDSPAPVRNITDPDSRLMPVRGGGFIQGYNPQNVTSADELIIATELTSDTADTGWFQPMMAAAEDAAALITAHRAAAGHPASDGDTTSDGDSPGSSASPDGGPGYRPPPPEDCAAQTAWLIKLLLSDAGYCSQANINAPGPPRLIATGKLRDLEKTARDRDGALPGASEARAAMAARLATPEGIAAYRQRSHIAETPHGHIKHNMGFRQLSVRGKPKAAAEWRFAAAVHNLFKAITTGHLTAAALAHLGSRAAYPPAAPA